MCKYSLTTTPLTRAVAEIFTPSPQGYSNLVSSVYATVGIAANIVTPKYELSHQMMDFLSFLDSKKLHVETQHKLLSNGVDSLEVLHALHQSDLVQFDLPLGQLRN